MYRFVIIRFRRRQKTDAPRIHDINDVVVEQQMQTAEMRAKQIIKNFPQECCEVWDGKTGRCVWRE